MNDMTPFAVEAGMAQALRFLAMDAVEQAKSGHPGMPMGMADVATVLFNRFLNVDPTDPRWPDRDRFVLSAGHPARPTIIASVAAERAMRRRKV